MHTFLKKVRDDQLVFIGTVITLLTVTQRIISGEQITEQDFAPILVASMSPMIRTRKTIKKSKSRDTENG